MHTEATENASEWTIVVNPLIYWDRIQYDEDKKKKNDDNESRFRVVPFPSPAGPLPSLLPFLSLSSHAKNLLATRAPRSFYLNTCCVLIVGADFEEVFS